MRNRSGKGMGRGRGRLRGYGLGPAGYCFCPQCGIKVSHQRGVPCNQERCPKCNGRLIRQNINQSPSIEITNSSQPGNSQENQWKQDTLVKKQRFQFPKINRKKCIGCGICADNCPTGAINIKKGKAEIDSAKCKNCRICVDVCPNNAIS
jgi:Pyruvate/2-oxoacid:ferredoxin oxidoreductase delta subunit